MSWTNAVASVRVFAVASWRRFFSNLRQRPTDQRARPALEVLEGGLAPATLYPFIATDGLLVYSLSAARGSQCPASAGKTRMQRS